MNRYKLILHDLLPKFEHFKLVNLLKHELNFAIQIQRAAYKELIIIKPFLCCQFTQFHLSQLQLIVRCGPLKCPATGHFTLHIYI